jgi:hypothetical protein
MPSKLAFEVNNCRMQVLSIGKKYQLSVSQRVGQWPRRSHF